MKDKTLAVFCPSPAMVLMRHLGLLYAQACLHSHDQPHTWGSPDVGTAGTHIRKGSWSGWGVWPMSKSRMEWKNPFHSALFL